MRVLMCFVDTEGGVINSGKYKNLSDIFIKVNSIWDIDSKIKLCRHLSNESGVFQFNHTKNAELDDIKKPLKSFARSLDAYCIELKIVQLTMICWGSSVNHDEKALNPLINQLETKVLFLNGADYYKNAYRKFHESTFPIKNKFSISYLMTKYELGQQRHNAYDDVMDMINIMTEIHVEYSGVSSDVSSSSLIRSMIESRPFQDTLFNDKFIAPVSIVKKKAELPSDKIIVDNFVVDNERYIIRSGWSLKNNYGYGLYRIEKDGSRKLITNQTEKQRILVKYKKSIAVFSMKKLLNSVFNI